MTYKVYLLSIFFSMLVFSCREKEKMEGPDLHLLYGEFGVIEDLESSSDNVDFAAGEKVYFTARFKKIVNWTLRLKGLTSGGVKEISGKSSELDAGNTLWNGTVTFLPVIKSEVIAAELVVPETSDTLRDTLNILTPKIIQSGLVLTDFEISNPAFSFDYSADGDSLKYFTGPVQPAFGSTYFYMAGKDNSQDTYLGQIGIEASDVFTSSVFNTGTTNPSQLYFNIAVYGTGVPDSRLDVWFKEDDNGDNVFNGTNEDIYVQNIVIDWVGWKMVSLKYDEGSFLSYGGAPGTNGNKVLQPNRIFEIDFVHMTQTAGSKSSLAIDYPVFTVFNVFQP